MTKNLLRQEPPKLRRKPQRPWGDIVRNLRDTAPDEWHLVDEDVSTSVSTYLRSNYGVDARLVGVDSKTHRAAELYIKWVSGQSFLAARAQRQEREDEARRARIKAAGLEGAESDE